MRILFAFTGFVTSAQRYGADDLLGDIALLSTTHASEVNYLLLCYWLEKMGHAITMGITSSGVPRGMQTHFPCVTLDDADPASFDALFIFKVHGLRLAARTRLLSRGWKEIAAWLDLPYPEYVLEDQARLITRFAWGTEPILANETCRWPNAKHVLCEHATTFPSPPPLGPTLHRGLYAGRMPRGYLDEVVKAATASPMLVYALWIEHLDGQRTLLRPGQHAPGDLEKAHRAEFTSDVELRPGSNMVRCALGASSATFGLCPATSGGEQQWLSASKFYDYLALGLPVVLADNTPEAQHIRQNTQLGELYQQGSESASLHAAIHKIYTDAMDANRFAARRLAVQNWVFNNATYQHRAKVLHDLLSS